MYELVRRLGRNARTSAGSASLAAELMADAPDDERSVEMFLCEVEATPINCWRVFDAPRWLNPSPVRF
jgi:hypothetical protein